MAGSYKHCVDEKGNFISDRKEFSTMIPNSDDWFEAAEEMVFMIKHLSLNDLKKIDGALDDFYKNYEVTPKLIENREDCL